MIIDNTQTGLQYSDRIDVMGTGTINIDDHQQLQLTTQYYKSESDGKHGLFLGDNFAAVTGDAKAYNKDNPTLTVSRHRASPDQPAVLEHRLLGQDLVAQIYYRDESLTYYPFPTLSKGAVTSIGASQQKTDFTVAS